MKENAVNWGDPPLHGKKIRPVKKSSISPYGEVIGLQEGSPRGS
ncbi:hypothetical protein [Paenibacillus paeoniae]|nr:hypothetical protein [Paenibacillus paeoniae]